MIPSLAGWSWQPRADSIELSPDAAPDACTIRYVERVRPLVSPIDAARAISWPPDARVEPIAPPRSLVTAEGEYAAIATLDARIGALHVRRAIGVVVGDDFYARIVGGTHVAAWFDEVERTVEWLTVEDRHILGVRRRRYRYATPTSWLATPDGLFHVRFTAPDDPSAILTVYPALPRDRDRRSIGSLIAEHRAARGLGLDEGTSTSLTTRRGLSGDWWTAHGHHRRRDIAFHQVCLCDATYLYPVVMLAADARAHRDVLAAVVDSIEPIPRADGGCADANVFGHYA